MRISALFLLLLPCSVMYSKTDTGSDLWNELTAKRQKFGSIHQEFEATTSSSTANGNQRSSKRQVIVDLAGQRWREHIIAGYMDRSIIFDGSETLSFEEGGSEYIRSKEKDPDYLPGPYRLSNPDFRKVSEVKRGPCGLKGADHQCVVIDVPLLPQMRAGTEQPTKVLGGTARILLDLDTGLLISATSVETVDDGRGGYRTTVSYSLKRMTYGAPVDEALFRLPEELKQVSHFSAWDASAIKKRLGGKPAPELSVTGLNGAHITLDSLKGKTVLLDFFTTWCPPCREDAPALDKLYTKYGDNDLEIVSFSVAEDRQIVEKFLEKHPHAFPIVLTTENEMPRPYQISVYPTYIMIDRDGNVAGAVEGNQGFAELKKLLKKAGLQVDF